MKQSLRADTSHSIVAPDVERSRVPVQPQCASKLHDVLVVEPVLLVASGHASSIREMLLTFGG